MQKTCVVDVQLGSEYGSELCMLEWRNVFNSLQIFFLHKLEWNWSNIFIAVCILKEFPSIFNMLRMLEPHFCKNFVSIDFLEGWNFALNVFKNFALNFIVVLAKYYKLYEPCLTSNLNKKKKKLQNKVLPILQAKTDWEPFFFFLSIAMYKRWNAIMQNIKTHFTDPRK